MAGDKHVITSRNNCLESPMLKAHSQCTLLDLLDRLLNTGVVIRGDITISVANVDLIYLQLNLLLTTIDRIISSEMD